MRSGSRIGRWWDAGWWGGALLLALIALALAAPLIAPQDPSDPLGFDPLAANHPPSLSWTYLLGADARGRSVLALLLWGSRVTLAIGVGAALLAAALGVLLGALYLWRTGLLDAAISRLMELCQAAPPLLILLLLADRLGGVPAAPMLAVFALTGWVAPARLTRAMLAAGWRAPHVDAARAVGVAGPRLLVVHLLPAVVAPLASLARRVVYAGQRLVIWPGRGTQPALVRRETDGTAALVSSRDLPLSALERMAAGLQ